MHRVVPELIVENYREGRFRGEFPAVGMFLDLSGFSTMTDTLMQHGQHGAEVLAGLMHSVFNPLVESIFDYGGKIVSFAGDGIMALYPVESDEKATAMRALASAWVIQQHLAEGQGRQTVYGKFIFSAKIGLTVGTVNWQILRSEEGDQATYYFRGSAVDDSAEAEHLASAGEIILTPGLNDLLTELIHTRPHNAFHRFIEFHAETPGTIPYDLPAIDLIASRVFMPEDVIIHDMRGEFRQIVNLFIRIPDLPDEKLTRFMNTVFALRKKYGGLLTRLDFGDKGCNMLMLWGAPVAYENDIGRALNFILELQKSMDFPITAGVTYYIAHAGYLGSAMCEDYTCYGWGVNLASRFMMGAPDGEIWVDERVAGRVSQRFEIDHVGSQSFKGFAAEQKVNVLRARKSELELIYQGEMVGRDDELNQLNEFVEPIWHEKFAGVLAVTGDAGIGKGMLIHAFRTSQLFDDEKALWGMCLTDQILRQSFNPLRGWLLRYFGILPDHNANERRLAFDRKLDELHASVLDLELALELDRTRSILGALVDVYWEDSLYSQLDAEARYNNTFLALIALIKSESLRQPLILFVDDVQFIDQDSKTFLSLLKRALSAADSYPVAIILTHRKQGATQPVDADLVDSSIELKGISKSGLSRLVEVLLGGPVSPTLKELVMSRSEGNPYFAEQVIRYLQDENLLEMSASGWTQVIRARRSLLPGDIRALLVARLDQLAQEVKNVVQTASVLGREFEVRVLSRMLGSEADASEYVLEAEKASIWSPLNEIRYIFYHGLLRDAAYTMQMRARRQELHILALTALEGLHLGDLKTRYAELAYHAEHGSLRTKAQDYYTLAGRASSELYQNHQAVDYFTQALALTPSDDLTTHFDLVSERVELFSRIGNRDRQLDDLNSLERWAGQLKDSTRIAKMLMLHSAYCYFTGNYQGALEYAKRAEDYSESQVDTELALYTQVVWSVSLLHLGRLDEAMTHARKTLERDRHVGNKKETSRILSAMGWIALDQNQPTAAHEYLLESLEIAREIKEPGLETRALNQLAMLEGSVNGNYGLALEYYETCHELSREIGDRFMEVGSLANMGFAAGMLGDLESALSYHTQSLMLAREIGDVNQEMLTLVNLSALTGIQNDAATALQYAQGAGELARTISDRSGEAWAELYVGHACLLLNDPQSARSAYRKSIAIRKELAQPSLSMEPIAGLVESYLYENDLVNASQEAEKILAFLESGSTLDGTDEPLRVYHTCYLLLNKKQDPRSRQVLQTAMNMLEAQVSNFKDDSARRRYIENIPWRRAVRDAAQAS